MKKRGVFLYFLMVAGLLTIVFTLLQRLAWDYSLTLKSETYHESELSRLEVQTHAIQSYFDTKLHLNFQIASAVPTEMMEDELQTSDWSATKKLFKTVAQTDRDIHQIRVIDHRGFELLNLKHGEEGDMVWSNDLTEEVHLERPYFTSIEKSGSELYVSPVELSMEMDTIERPYRPIILISSPIKDSSQTFLGTLVVTYDLTQFIDQIVSKDLSASTAEHYLLNDDGYYLSSNESIQPFGWLLPGQHQHRFNDMYADVWKAFDANRGVVSADKGSFFYRKILLYDDVIAPGFELTLNSLAEDQTWFLIKHVGAEEAYAQVSDHKKWWNIGVATIYILILLFSYSLALNRYYILQSRSNLERQVTEHSTALQDAQQRFRGIFNNTFTFIGLLQPDGTLLEANDAALEFGGFKRSDAVGKKFWEAPWWSHDPNVVQRLKEAIVQAAKGKMVRYDVLVQGGNGNFITIDFNLRPILNEKGKVIYLVPEGRDVSEREALTRALDEERERFKRMFNHSPIGTALVGLDGRFEQVNLALAQIFGYNEEELRAKTFQEMTHPEDLEIDLKLVQEVVERKRSEYRIEKRYFHKNGKVITTELQVSGIPDSNGNVRYFVSQIRDLTEERAIKARLELSLRTRQAILDSSPSSIMAFKSIRNDHGEIIDFEWTLVNKAGTESVGLSEDQLIGKRLLRLMPANEESGLFEKYRQVVETGESIDFTHYYDGEHVQRTWFHTLAVKLGDGFTVAYEDITLEVEAETKQAELISHLQSRNRQLEEINFMISHNLRSPFSNLSVLLDFLSSAKTEEEQEAVVQRLKKVTSNITVILDDLTDAVKLQSALDVTAEEFRTSEVFASVLALYEENILRSESKVIQSFDAWDVISYPKSAMESILSNLLSNAIKYRDNQRPLEVQLTTELEDGQYILKFSDNGRGIDLDRFGNDVFKLNKTFHRDKPGKGLGLYMTKVQIESLGGSIDVESHVDRGTTFTIKLKPHEG